jgi:hypothetical protein
VENSGRRIATSGRSGTLYHYLILPAVTTCKSIRVLDSSHSIGAGSRHHGSG